MSPNKQLSVRWFDERKGKLTYSMYGSRNGSDGTADCSGSITQSIKDAGGKTYAFLYSTVTLAPYLTENGYERIAVNQEWDAKEGDIVMMSWGRSMADSAGAGGHVGVMKNAWDFISVDYWTGGQKGTAVSEHNIDNYLNVNRPSYFEVWRLKDSGSAVKPVEPSKPSQKRRFGYRVDEVKFINGLWQIRCNSLAPAGFDWTDNGINATDVDMIDPGTGAMLADQQTIRQGRYFAFNESRVSDTGVVVSDHGHNFRKFNFTQPTGDVWLVRGSKQQLVYG
ncbi:lytic exoenzyme target recognition domain-containing protein [Enterococcus sp. 5H]|uniref:lytic exoenzyme target recognition domain-containing protein n=1 Tax=Enterococcus sp. 5H TaxID=1229490 RepID=UPI002303A19F|nr:lytic exoenzyme target recognition domain-containing protein [Enterococcus sp. 5H]MDA9469907.1 Phage lysin, N-acetylmuramoyl-L-alanine amidase [Enterococcus sp. 5H]